MALACTLSSIQRAAQAGQALFESLLAMAALAVLWAGLHWLAHYQDAALSATHASRYAAFVATRTPDENDTQARLLPFFTGPAHRWTDRRGRPVLQAETSVHLARQRMPALSEQAQPGVGFSQAAVLRRDWALEDRGVLQASVALSPQQSPTEPEARAPSILRLDVFDLAYPPLTRSVSIIAGAGHAESDSAAQSRLSASTLAWSAAHAASRAAGEEVQRRAAGVDEGWGRSAPDFDWLQPWSGHVPRQFLTEYLSLDGGY